ncbi:MAG: ribonuclease H-like domain-containing protein [Thermoplasmata archaeon]
MLRHTFVFLRGVGRAMERRLWSVGVRDWRDFLETPKIPGIGRERKAAFDAHLLALDRCLIRGNASVLFESLPVRERWRIYPDFRHRAAFLDIETTGLDIRADITVVGVFLADRYTPLIRGINLCEANLRRVLSNTDILVTFNGSSFDLPMLRASFPSLPLNFPHLDLRHIAPRAGLHGGLKRVERALGISRPREIRLLVSHDAAYLWRIWERKGSRNALRLLIDYNRADCQNLRAVADEVVRRLAERVGLRAGAVSASGPRSWPQLCGAISVSSSTYI